jgi:hypothetical protein
MKGVKGSSLTLTIGHHAGVSELSLWLSAISGHPGAHQFFDS